MHASLQRHLTKCRNAWGVTPIDSLSTAIIMEESDIVNQILKYAATVDFTTTKEVNSSISLFETNIRYLGGLLAGKRGFLTDISIQYHLR